MRLGIAIGLVCLLGLTVPWFFIGSGEQRWGGWPVWAIYSLLMNVLFALVTAVLLKRAWELFRRSDD